MQKAYNKRKLLKKELKIKNVDKLEKAMYIIKIGGV